MSNLNRAITIALAAHAGQVDKGGHPYIMHPVKVMLSLKSEEARIVAVLHDVLEDCPDYAWMVEQAGFSQAILDALRALTQRHLETYSDFIARVGLNPLATEVKIADMRDNMDLSRIPFPTDKDYERIEKYRTHIAILTA